MSSYIWNSDEDLDIPQIANAHMKGTYFVFFLPPSSQESLPKLNMVVTHNLVHSGKLRQEGLKILSQLEPSSNLMRTCLKIKHFF